jgi:hypothetical protein
LQKKYDEDYGCVVREKQALLAEFERVKADLLSKVHNAEEEVGIYTAVTNGVVGIYTAVTNGTAGPAIFAVLTVSLSKNQI